MMSGEYDILETLLIWCGEGNAVALATVVQTWGSAPRPVGSQMVITETGDFAGSVSGGCVEGAVIAEAQDVLATGKMRLLEYGVTNDQAWELGLACGGTIQIMIQTVGAAPPDSVGITTPDLAEIIAVKSTHLPRFAITNLKSFRSELVTSKRKTLDQVADSQMTRQRLQEAMTSNTSQKIAADTDWFLRVYSPPLRLVIVGAVHIAEPLSAMMQASNYDVTIVDPRPAFASAKRFPDAEIVNAWPDEEMPTLDAQTALVALTHDPKLDDPALRAALNSPCFYIGALGSRKNHAARLDRLAGQGFAPDALSRINGPVGLAIGAKTPAEIAIAIAAQITAALRQGQTP